MTEGAPITTLTAERLLEESFQSSVTIESVVPHVADKWRQLPTVSAVETSEPEFGSEFKRLQPLYEAAWERMRAGNNR